MLKRTGNEDLEAIHMVGKSQAGAEAAAAQALLEGFSAANKQSGMLAHLAQRHAEKIGQTHWPALQQKLDGMSALLPALSAPDAGNHFQEYLTDYFQRSILFFDVLRQRGNNYIKREQEGFKPVLVFDYDLVVDGRELDRRTNYALVRIRPPEDFPPQREDGRPFVIIDPRAGHGSGIGGFKADSEVGVALRDGHPVYFVIFFTDPEPSQTLADVCAAEAVFMETIKAQHPHAPPPLVVGNCQGGWAAMILSATRPHLVGPTVIAGAPLSYWAGELGKNPFRYLGGVFGGTVPTLLASDLGAGRFDGASLILNFETLNPANTWWKKYYDVFSDVDKKASEFLKFENWWSCFYFMNENEMRWILENLFIGNKLTRGEAVLPDGTPIDLTQIKAPVVVFASHGDNITPPQQALNWIPDLYHSVDEIKARGHVIIYTLHNSVGHLGIFVSAKVATEHHQQITSVVKTIEALAPGLYEMLIDETQGGHEVSFEARTIDHILSHGGDREEEVEFAAVAKVSEWATKTYELTMRPAIRSVVTPRFAQHLSALNPLRQQRRAFSNQNPLMKGIEALADEVRRNRQPVRRDNPFYQLERLQAALVEQSWNFLRDSRDAWIELAFHSIYGTPWMKAAVKFDYQRVVSHDVKEFPEVKNAIERVNIGGYEEAVVRILLLLARARGAVRRDRLERADKMLHTRPPFDTMKPDQRIRMIHEQNLIVQFAPEGALLGLREMLKDEVERIHAVNIAMSISGPVDDMDRATYEMFRHIQTTLVTYARGWRKIQFNTAAE